MSEQLDPVMADFYARLPQQGPGSDADAEIALGIVSAKLPASPVVADLGCGTGRSTLFLAERLRSKVMGVDLEPRFCERLRRDAEACDLSDLVDVREGDMSDPPVDAGSLDLLWSEGAAYIIGFSEALQRWRPLVRPNGFSVVSECTWLSEDPPDVVERYFALGYPDMTSVDGNIRKARAAGYEVLGTHVMSEHGWQQYYDPIKRMLPPADGGRLDPALEEELLEEVAVYEQSAGSYGYVFYAMQRVD